MSSIRDRNRPRGLGTRIRLSTRGVVLLHIDAIWGLESIVGIAIVLTVYHVWLANYAAALARGERRFTGKKLRMLNEVPGLAAALIVVLVIVKPF